MNDLENQLLSAFARYDKRTHGGKRAGAGRPRKADSRQLVNFTLSRETVAALRKTIPPRGRSMFVEVAIDQALGRV